MERGGRKERKIRPGKSTRGPTSKKETHIANEATVEVDDVGEGPSLHDHC